MITHKITKQLQSVQKNGLFNSCLKTRSLKQLVFSIVPNTFNRVFNIFAKYHIVYQLSKITPVIFL